MAFAVVWAFCVLVHGGKASVDRDALKCTQLRMHEGVPRPSKAWVRCGDRLARLPTKPTSWLCS